MVEKASERARANNEVLFIVSAIWRRLTLTIAHQYYGSSWIRNETVGGSSFPSHDEMMYAASQSCLQNWK